MSMTRSAVYDVQLWGTHPDEGNDDWWTSKSCDTWDEVLAVVAHPFETFGRDAFTSRTIAICYESYDGPGGSAQLEELITVRCSDYDAERTRREDVEFEQSCRQERAMQAGMAFGCAGYNDEMGW
jgi:hypothetical protein